jgi:hypothetical protein
MDGGITCLGNGSQIRADCCICLLVDDLIRAMGTPGHVVGCGEPCIRVISVLKLAWRFRGRASSRGSAVTPYRPLRQTSAEFNELAPAGYCGGRVAAKHQRGDVSARPVRSITDRRRHWRLPCKGGLQGSRDDCTCRPNRFSPSAG